MFKSVPVRYSKQWWALLALAALLSGAIALLVLRRFGFELNIVSLSLLVLAMFVGDLLTALGMEAIAPTHITVGPGEKATYESSIVEKGKVVSGFVDGSSGRVRIRGEIWRARIDAGNLGNLGAGDAVSIIGREGLTLLVSVGDDDN